MNPQRGKHERQAPSRPCSCSLRLCGPDPSDSSFPPVLDSSLVFSTGASGGKAQSAGTLFAQCDYRCSLRMSFSARNPVSLLLYMCIAYKIHSDKASGHRYLSNTNCETENVCRVVGLAIWTGLRSGFIYALSLGTHCD